MTPPALPTGHRIIHIPVNGDGLMSTIEGQAIDGVSIAQLDDNGGTLAAGGAYRRVFERPTTFWNENDGVWLLIDVSLARGLPDLYFVKTSNTPNGHVEVHVATGASEYQQRGLETATTFGNENDGTWGMVYTPQLSSKGPDLYFIKTSNTPSGRVEVHIASASSNYQTRTVAAVTTFTNEDNGIWALVPSGQPGPPDLVYVKTRNTPNGKVEVHIASGGSGYRTRTLETPTTFASEEDGTWGLVPTYNGRPDLYFIKTANTPSGNVEVHIASGASDYQTRTLEVETDFRNETDGTWSLVRDLPARTFPPRLHQDRQHPQQPRGGAPGAVQLTGGPRP
jgi:hypothetical protein